MLNPDSGGVFRQCTAVVIERFITEHCEHDCEAAGQEECVREYNTEDYDGSVAGGVTMVF